MSDVAATSPARVTAPRWPTALAVALFTVFALGVLGRPAGDGWDTFFDLGLYNAVNVAAMAGCLVAARRATADRLAWWAMFTALGTMLLGDVVYTLAITPMAEEPFPSVADAFYLAYYVPLYVALVALIRSRVPRFHASMWLDGVVGALGAGAVAVAVVLRPALQIVDG